MAATSPHQYALSTRAGCECIAHALQGLTELDPRATVTSIDGVSAFDLISRGTMMTGLMRVEGGSAALPFVRMFYGAPSEHLWVDSCTVRVRQAPYAPEIDYCCCARKWNNSACSIRFFSNGRKLGDQLVHQTL